LTGLYIYCTKPNKYAKNAGKDPLLVAIVFVKTQIIMKKIFLTSVMILGICFWGALTAEANSIPIGEITSINRSEITGWALNPNTSKIFSSDLKATISADTAQTEAGGSIAVTWNNPGTTNPRDWIALVPANQTWSSDHDWPWVYTNGLHSGTTSFTVPASIASLQFVYYINDGFTELMRTAAVSVLSPSASYTVENSKIRMTLSSDGFISSFFNKQTSTELISSQQRFFTYNSGTAFTNLSVKGNEITLSDSAKKVTMILAVDTTDDYFLFTVKSLNIASGQEDISSVTLNIKTVLNDTSTSVRKFYVGNDNFTLIGMPFSPNVSANVQAGTGFLFLKAEAYGDFSASLVNSKFMLITSSGRAMSFATDDAIARIQTKFGMYNSSLSDVYLPTLFTWSNKPIGTIADQIISYAKGAGFKNIMIWSGYWSKGDGFWDVNPSYFSGDKNKLKWFVDKIHSAGLKASLHFLPTHLSKNNPFASNPENRLKCSDGSDYDNGSYLVNLKSDSVMNAVMQNYADIINFAGVDSIYIDGYSDSIPYGSCLPSPAAYYYENEFFDILRPKLVKNTISVQTSGAFPYFQPFSSKRQAITDGYGCADTKICNDIKNWVDTTGRARIINLRNLLITPELGWVSYMPDLNKPIYDYEYLLSAAIAYGTPLTFENSWTELQSGQSYQFKNALNKYLTVYNRYAGRSILKETSSNYDFTQYESGLAAFSVRGNTDLPVGQNRKVWVHVKQNIDPAVNLKFTNLKASTKYLLSDGKKISSDLSGNTSATVYLSRNQEYNFFELKNIDGTSIK